nr:PAS domain S-box protein [uncultured Desulfobacter sp.]
MKDEGKTKSQLIAELQEKRKQVAGQTRPLKAMEDISFEELFNLSEIQHLQDLYSNAFGVAAIITRPDGTPITRPSNFTVLCSQFIRNTEKGRRNCEISDAMIGRKNPDGPIIEPCLSAGLWDAGASIIVDGHHIANWLFGQVRNESQNEEKIVAYARDLGVDKTKFRAAYRQVPEMSLEQFEKVAQVIFFAANQLSKSAYQNLQQARFITEKKRTEESLQRTQFCVDHATMGIYQIGMNGCILNANPYAAKMLGYTVEELTALSIPDIDSFVSVDTMNADIAGLTASGQRNIFETVHVRKDGSHVPVEITGTILKYKAEQYYIAFVQEISERKQMEEALRLTQFMFDKAPIGIWTMGVDGKVLDVNEQGCSSLGYSREELCRMTVSDFDPNFDTENWDQNIAALKALGTRSIESLHRRKNGEIFPIQVTEKMVSFKDKEIHVAFIQDITEQKKAEKALQENQELLTNILESMDEAVRVYDQNYVYQLVNKKYEKMAGRSRQEVMGKTPWEVLPHLKNTLLEHSIRKAMTGEIVTNIETQIKDFGETEVWAKDSFSPIKNLDGDIIGVVGVGNDITQQKRDKEELREKDQLLRDIGKLVKVGGWKYDIETGKATWTDEVSQIHDLESNQELSVEKGLCFFHGEHRKKIECAFNELLEQGTPYDLVLEFVSAKGICKWVRTIGYPVMKDGRVVQLQGAMQDITEHKRMEEMMIQSEKMLSVGGLAAGMAHEINNPMAGMMQTAQVLSQRLSTGTNIPANLKAAEAAGTTMESIEQFMENRGIPRMIDAISESGERISKIVTNMLSFARKDNAAVSSHDLNEILDKTIGLAATDYDLKKKYDFKQIKIVKEYNENLPVVPCQASKIQQVLLNILTNGAQAMQDAGTSNAGFILRTYIDSARNMACIEIQDNGPGMDEKTRKKIFDPFFTTKPEGVGTGLGLSVSYFIITENHRGKMTVESSPGAGAKFIIRLPVKG